MCLFVCGGVALISPETSIYQGVDILPQKARKLAFNGKPQRGKDDRVAPASEGNPEKKWQGKVYFIVTRLHFSVYTSFMFCIECMRQ